jgi:hypothetical protein
MDKPLTIDDINRVQEEVMALEAQARIDAGSKDLFDVWMVNYHKGTPEQREKLMQALAEHNEALRSGPFGWLYD